MRVQRALMGHEEFDERTILGTFRLVDAFAADIRERGQEREANNLLDKVDAVK
jgi:hypothetical protein